MKDRAPSQVRTEMTKVSKHTRSPIPATNVLRSMATSLLGVLIFGLSIWPICTSASQALAQKYACVACHQPAVKVVGPTWRDIAERYGDGKGSAAQLAASIKSGSSGKWGAMPMPAQARVPDTDLQTLAQWLVDGAK
jgi:cytochrome c